MAQQRGSSSKHLDQVFRLLDDEGGLLDDERVVLGDEEQVALLQLMKLSRAVDERAVSLQRQGRFGTLSTVTGQEASVAGSAFAIEKGRDWLVPQYRELPAMVHHGFPLEHFFLYFMGNPDGAYVPDGVRILPLQIALAAQLPHAAGLAWGRQLQGNDEVVITYFGDGASSEGDFHEACNLAGVMKAPVIFFLQNNGWAISTPRSIQSAASTFAHRAQGYGIAGELVDGNDALAVHAVTVEAVNRARAGDGPTLIEAQTYRMGPHNTADDPSRYESEESRNYWEQRDPIDLLRRHLESKALWDDDKEARVQEGIAQEIERALKAAFEHPPPSQAQVFDHLYSNPPRRLERQRASWKEMLA